MALGGSLALDVAHGIDGHATLLQGAIFVATGSVALLAAT